jgi:metal-responsive CopG/Arc/MetJ family transcriptional regulator
MRVKTSITLPSSLLKEIDRLDGNRSAFLERAALSYISKRTKSELDARDASILDRVADELNRQSDVLEFQGLPK